MSASALLLFEKFDLHSRLSAESAAEKIRHELDDKGGFFQSFFPSAKKRYGGKVNSKDFLIWRNGATANIFRPLIKGHLETTQEGILVNIHLHLSTISILLFLPLAAFISAILISIIRDQEYAYILLPLILILPVYAWAVLSVRSEAAKTKLFLQRILV